MDSICVKNLSNLRIELENQISYLKMPSYNLDLNKILKLSEGIKNRCKKQDDDIISLAQTIENLKREINREEQRMLQEVVNLISSIVPTQNA
jgi:hypothetical protein